MTEKFYYKSPIGILEIELKNDTIQRLRVVESCSKISERTGYFAEVVKQIDQYFAGKRTKFELNIYPKGTEFQKKVWAENLIKKLLKRLAILTHKEQLAQRVIKIRFCL